MFCGANKNETQTSSAMEEVDLQLLFKYPFISSTITPECKIYKGFIRIFDDDVNICIKQLLENGKPISNFLCEINGNQDFCSTIRTSLDQEQPRNIVTYLDNLVSLLSSKVMKPVNYSHMYSKVLHEYSEFTNFFLTLKNCKLSEDLQLIKVSMADDKHRVHYSEIVVNFEDKSKMFQLGHYDLPQLTSKELFSPNGSLIELYDQYAATIDTLQPYFDLMDTLDQNCYVLDPDTPKRAHTFRRIWLDDNLSVIITIQPSNIFSRPDMKFLGSDRLVDEYRNRLNENLEKWKDDTNIFDNILNILGISSFPCRTKQSDVNEFVLKNAEDCAICFNPRFSDKLPDVICKNKCCENYYHTECLYEWLVSINGKRIFNEIHGNCPNCEKSIACNIPFLNE